MKPKARIFSFSVLATLALARPFPRDAAQSEIDILNFALTLEHMENAFYAHGLAKFTHDDFVHAGFPDWSYGRLKQIAAHEAAHVKLLEATLGDKAIKPCAYKFPYDDPKSFVALGHALEALGASAYIGATKLFEDKEYLLAAVTILSTESRHSGWLDSAMRKGSAWSGPFDTPLDPNQALTIASNFIASCPPTNPKLSATTYAPLTLPDPVRIRPGSTTPLKFTAPSNLDRAAKLYGAFMSGQEAIIVPLDDDWKSVSIPDDLRGVVYLLVTSVTNSVDDSKIVAGPALLEFPFNSNGDPQNQSF